MARTARKKKFVCRTHAEVAEFCGVAVDSVKRWAVQGMPGTQGSYDLAKIVRWLRNSGPWKRFEKTADSDPLLAGGDDGESPGLERYRQAKAALAELELEQRKGVLIDKAKAKDALIRWASIIRRMGESLDKRFGGDAVEMLYESLAECESLVVYEFGSIESADDGANGGVVALPDAGEASEDPT